MNLTRISVTKISKALKCEKSLYYSLVTPPPLKKSVYLIMGTVFHSFLEFYFISKAKGRVLTWPEMLPVFEENWQKEKDKADFLKLDEGQAKNRCLTYLHCYYKGRCGVLYAKTPENVEMPLKLKIKGDGREILLTGKVDMLTSAGVVCDHKTGRQWTHQDYDKDPQAHLYQFGLRTNGIETKGFQFNVVNEKEVRVFDVAYNPGRVAELLNYILTLQRNFEEDNLFYAKNKWVCKSCEWRDNVCEKWKEDLWKG